MKQKLLVIKLGSPITYKTCSGIDHFSPEKTPHAQLYKENGAYYAEQDNIRLHLKDVIFAVEEITESLKTQKTLKQ